MLHHGEIHSLHCRGGAEVHKQRDTHSDSEWKEKRGDRDSDTQSEFNISTTRAKVFLAIVQSIGFAKDWANLFYLNYSLSSFVKNTFFGQNKLHDICLSQYYCYGNCVSLLDSFSFFIYSILYSNEILEQSSITYAKVYWDKIGFLASLD